MNQGGGLGPKSEKSKIKNRKSEEKRQICSAVILLTLRLMNLTHIVRQSAMPFRFMLLEKPE